MRGKDLITRFSGLSFYTGVVATRCSAGGNAQFLQTMSRCMHIACDNLSGFQIILNAWTRSASGEADCPADVTYTAAIEYPAGTFKQVTFAGSASGVCTAGGNLISDPIGMNIPNGATFYSRVYAVTASGGAPAAGGGSSAAGDACRTGNSGIVDQTMSGTITSNHLPDVIKPLIIGRTRKPSAAIFGNSLAAAGTGDTADATGLIGIIERPLGSNIAWANFAQSGQDLTGFPAESAKRIALAKTYCSTILNELGINDSARTLTQVKAALDTLIAQFPGKPFWQCTLTPVTTSTDSWATLANQTARQWASSSGTISDMNDYIRAGVSGVRGVFDSGGLLMSSANSNKWPVTGAANYATADGTHPSTVIYALNLANTANGVAGSIQASLLKR